MKQTVLLILLFLAFQGCRQKYTPKPRGYFRIDFPVKKYHPLDKKFPYRFDIPDYAKIVHDIRNQDKPFWVNVSVPANRANLHISYYSIDKKTPKGHRELSELMEESRRLAYKHSIKADAINEQIFINPAKNVYGTIYKIEGNAASPMQFFLTDSTAHFLRGALYIREVPNIDSLKPVINFLETDIVRLIETTSWN
ncbi:MAG: gliding motility lipoprotein GldD [Prolixibacteraceae bacterium]|nr:gliding motility lipoprotein GldD [Prolixibacteraceae bacterium]